MYLMYLICSLALVINIPKILKICGYLFEHRLHRLKGFFRKAQQTMRTSPEGTPPNQGTEKVFNTFKL